MLVMGDVWNGLVGRIEGSPPEWFGRRLETVVVDSRSVTPGGLFVALKGERTDGHLYLQDAFDRGALAAIGEADRIRDSGLPEADYIVVDCASGTIENPRSALSPQPARLGRDGLTTSAGSGGVSEPRVLFAVQDSLIGLQQLAGHWRAQMPAVAVGITGSVGKTTTKEIVASVLAQRFVTLRSEGNLNNEIGLPLTLLRLDPGHERVVLEMGMYALGEITRLCELARPRIGIVTIVGPAHLERLGTIECITQAKAELVQALPAAEDGGAAILNADDPRVQSMAGLTRARVFTYGLNPASDLWADEISSEGLEGIYLRVHYGHDAFHLHLPMLGRHSVHTALRGAAVGLVEGLSWAEIIAGLQQVQGQLRLMVVPGLRDTTLIDDTYNASPESMLAALNLLEDLTHQAGKKSHPPRQRSVAVLGDMYELGTFEEEGHRLVGGRAAQVLGLGPGGSVHGKLVTVGSRARWIAAEALASGMATADVHTAETNADAIAVLQGLIQAGDVILVKGSRAAAMESIVDALSRPRRSATEGDRPC
jgi:UDP-N-acetylmuramoyl-tripeptide--D-alanyl-D-alanine ligase